MVNDEYNQDPYQINIKEKPDNTKIIIFILIILSLICIILIGNYITKIIEGHKVYQQYEAQLNAMKYQQEQELAEAERKRQEKIPKLTDVRKTKYGKHLPIGY